MPHRFLKQFFAVAAVAFAALTAFTVSVDPYGLYGTTLPLALNKGKYETNAFERVIKSVAVKRLRPEAIALGTSRVAVGISPDVLASRFGRAYNLGINGAYLNEIDLALRLAVENGVQTVFLGLDYWSFTQTGTRPVDQLRAMRSMLSGGSTWQQFTVFVRHTLSIQAVLDAVINVINNIRKIPPSHENNGMYVRYDPANVPFKVSTSKTEVPLESAYFVFEQMLVFAKMKGVKFYIFTTPVFGSHKQNDPKYDAWLRRVIEIAASHQITVFDASSNPSYSGLRENFFDVGHFRPAIGKKIIENMLGNLTSKVN